MIRWLGATAEWTGSNTWARQLRWRPPGQMPRRGSRVYKGQGDEVRHRLLLVVTELATNAINAAPSQMFEIALAPIGLSGVSVRVTNGISGAGRSAHRCSASSGERGPNLETGPGDGAGRPHTIGGVERPGWDCSQTPVGVGRSKEPSYGSP